MLLEKSEFLEYIKSHDEPFCVDGNCPIAQWLSDTGRPVYRVESGWITINERGSTQKHPDWVRKFILEIDKFADFGVLNTRWREVTPDQCRQVLNNV